MWTPHPPTISPEVPLSLKSEPRRPRLSLFREAKMLRLSVRCPSQRRLGNLRKAPSFEPFPPKRVGSMAMWTGLPVSEDYRMCDMWQKLATCCKKGRGVDSCKVRASPAFCLFPLGACAKRLLYPMPSWSKVGAAAAICACERWAESEPAKTRGSDVGHV